MPQIYCSGGLVQLHFTGFSLITLKKQNNRLKHEHLDDPSSVRIDGSVLATDPHAVFMYSQHTKWCIQWPI